MINDVPRNVFYDKILSETVRGKKCCDIGFGTGLLSLLALKHGASSIIAYEKDPVRFELGQRIIKSLNLSSKIDLKNIHSGTADIENNDCDIVFHEIVHQGIWGEGLWHIRPSKQGAKQYIPGNYFFELSASAISDTTVDGFLNGDNLLDYFNPGVEINSEFVDLINRLILQNDSKKTQLLTTCDCLIKLDWNKIHKDWSWNPGHVFQHYPKTLLCKYNVDYNTCKSTLFDSRGTRECNFDSNGLCELSIDTSAWRGTNMMLEFRFGLEHGPHRLYLDDCRGWGAEVPWLFLKPESDLFFVQNFNGNTVSGQPFQLLTK